MNEQDDLPSAPNIKSSLEIAQDCCRRMAPLFANNIFLIADSDCVRLIIGQDVLGEFHPSGHIVVARDLLRRLGVAVQAQLEDMDKADAAARSRAN